MLFIIMTDKVAITGTGLVSSLGINASETWNSIVAGKSGIRPIEDFDARSFNCRLAAQAKGLGPAELNIHPRDSRIMDKHSYMLIKCSRDAFNQANLQTGSVSPEGIGYFAGMGMVDYNIEDLMPSVLKSLDRQGNLNYDEFFSHAYQEIHPLWPLSMLNNISFCQAAIDLNIKGENTVFSPHADSGMHAIIEAYHTVLEKKAKVILAGGVSEKVSPLSLARASFFGILNNNPSSTPHPALHKGEQVGNKGGTVNCNPFSKNRNGTVLGEGCGIITLELCSSAEERGTHCLAAIAGYGTSFEKNEESGCPTEKAVTLSMEHAVSNAGLIPFDIDLIIAHGDGTYVGDKNEMKAIHKTFADNIDKINVFSSKSALGHLLAGAPAVDVIIGIYILKNGIIPAVHSSKPLEDNILFNLVNDEPLQAHPKRILINSLSYEGQCASLIIEACD
jgi:3-oxoacyl-[acyl-carrier-protein] synthase II